MDGVCNASALQVQSQINTNVYHLVKVIILCVTCAINMSLSVPLVLACMRCPSLLGHTRFLLLVNLLCCNVVQLLQWTIMSIIMVSNQVISGSQCLVFTGLTHACGNVGVVLSAARSVDRCLAITCPLRYDLLLSPRGKKAVVVVIWTTLVMTSGALVAGGMTLINVGASLPRCWTRIFAPCVSDTSVLVMVCIVGQGLLFSVSFLATLACLVLLCWSTQGNLLHIKRALVTLALQAGQTILFSVPMVMNSYLVPSDLHGDSLDIAVTTTYSLGIAFLPLVYGYRSRELQQRILQAIHWNRTKNNS